ncbi:MAG TPA: non-homologous end-joining DNA ligase [Tepidisphaeraceae bacterium]|nr:non-homologous end-joining DNA ligase [Tepidisphaeraceae bacterium]
MARSSSILAVRHRRAAAPAMPTSIEPMLAVLSELPRDPAHWAFEYKWDGVRAISYWDGKRLTIQSRNRLDITRRYPELMDLGKALGKQSAILDGEIVALDENGRPSFPRLQKRMHAEGTDNIRRLSQEVPAWYVLFDVLWADGRSLIELPYSERRRILEELTVSGPAWQITPAHVGQGEAMLEAARKNKLEGVVAKRLDGVYEPGRRSPSWLKIKVIFGQELVIGGWVPEKNLHHDRVGSLLMGYYDCPAKGKAPIFHYAGSVGTGYNAATHAMLTRELKRRASEKNPFADPVPKKDARFVTPDLVAEVEYRRWPAGGLIQQASFKGLREDKDARDVVKEG